MKSCCSATLQPCIVVLVTMTDCLIETGAENGGRFKLGAVHRVKWRRGARQLLAPRGSNRIADSITPPPALEVARPSAPPRRPPAARIQLRGPLTLQAHAQH